VPISAVVMVPLGIWLGLTTPDSPIAGRLADATSELGSGCTCSATATFRVVMPPLEQALITSAAMPVAANETHLRFQDVISAPCPESGRG
jgi:hypothetical protein